eukprot:3019078-Ditylum_brightwellii.AAC.1
MGLGGCRCPILCNAICNSSTFFALVYKAAILALELDAMIFHINLHTECTGLLRGMCSRGGLVGSSGLEEREKWLLALLHMHSSDI